MSVGLKGLHFKVAGFIGLVNFERLILKGTAKMKLAILAFLYFGEFVNNSKIQNRQCQNNQTP